VIGGRENSMAKEKVQKPQLWNGAKWVNATKGMCDKCGKDDGYIAIRGKIDTLCFTCYDKRMKQWGGNA